ncbi:MAG: c-type cytochrome [Betaproteobacteria bacterium]|nr:c-type cytochrome [Betaproteobacteria bacterium]
MNSIKRITHNSGLFSLCLRATFLAVLSTSAMAQSGGAKPVDDSLRTLYVSPAEIAEGKSLADAQCTRCHGNDGISVSKGIPHLAGQRPAYLHIEMKAYQTAARTDKHMVAAAKFLSSDALLKVAAYYASLDPPNPASAKGGSARPDPLQAGKAAASGCAGCHGEGGNSKTGGMPNLTGQDPKFLVAAMKAYKGGQRKHEMMKTLLADLTEPGMNNIALYYGLQKPGKAQTPSPGDQAAGKTAAADCAGCHGDQGISGNPATPSLAGQDAEYFVEALKAYKNNSRNDDTMKTLASGMDEKTMKNLAAYYANLQPQPPKVKKPLTTKESAQNCDRCHGLNGNSTDPLVPSLAAQRVEYLETVLRAYQKGERKNSKMAAMTTGLTDSEIENLSAHYAQQKARAVVFVAAPSK